VLERSTWPAAPLASGFSELQVSAHQKSTSGLHQHEFILATSLNPWSTRFGLGMHVGCGGKVVEKRGRNQAQRLFAEDR
jgi:hypothetical protein